MIRSAHTLTDDAPSWRRTPLRTPLRYPAAVLLVVAGVAHIPITPMHLKEAPYIGALFIALTAVCFALALTLPFHDSPTVWALTAAVTIAAVLAYVLSRTVALPQIGDDVGNWTEPLGLLSITTEFLSAALSVIALKSNHEAAP
ncbi:hypothetical protein AB0I93_15695 [Streptomyces sp. NPDC049967]|uniref:hypothetical protein n=1 Tax=unclassified Streptomyces TaxID=2593676 RepID=UPI002E2D1A96|nr:hypothetical protein [Streptomyces sp. NBC_00342]